MLADVVLNRLLHLGDAAEHAAPDPLHGRLADAAAWAMVRTDQCVAPGGVCCVVNVMISVALS